MVLRLSKWKKQSSGSRGMWKLLELDWCGDGIEEAIFRLNVFGVN